MNATPVATITKRKSRLKTYSGNKVYLNDGDTFEIELYNPKQISVLCKIKLNGNYISSSGVVIQPGQRIFLERYIDSNNKFIFSTYEVGNSKSTQKAIEMNGVVEVEFYDEYTPPPTLSWSSVYYNDTAGTPNYIQDFTVTSYNAAMTTTCMDNLSFMNQELNRSPKLNKSRSIETGRVGKGEKSNQYFTQVDMIFNTYTSHIVKYQILPESTMPVFGHTIRKYCTNCGTKLKKTYKYCPNCGESS